MHVEKIFSKEYEKYKNKDKELQQAVKVLGRKGEKVEREYYRKIL